MSDAPWIEIWAALEAVATALTLGVVGVAAWWGKGQLEEVKRHRQLMCLTDLSDRWSSALLRKARRIAESAGDEFDQEWKRLEDTNSPDFFTLGALVNFFEDLALLEKEGQLTLEQVVDRFGPTLVHYHEIYAGFIENQQKQNPEILANFCALVDRTRQHSLSKVGRGSEAEDTVARAAAPPTG